MECTTFVSKTKVLISCLVTVQLIGVFKFVFAYAKSSFSYDLAHNLDEHIFLLKSLFRIYCIYSDLYYFVRELLFVLQILFCIRKYLNWCLILFILR